METLRALRFSVVILRIYVILLQKNSEKAPQNLSGNTRFGRPVYCGGRIYFHLLRRKNQQLQTHQQLLRKKTQSNCHDEELEDGGEVGRVRE